MICLLLGIYVFFKVGNEDKSFKLSAREFHSLAEPMKNKISVKCKFDYSELLYFYYFSTGSLKLD